MQIKHDPSCAVGLIPARCGSKRLPDKNIRLLGGKPLLAHTIKAALDSAAFGAVYVSTDSPHYATIAREHGAEVPFLRPVQYAQDISPDIDWVLYMLKTLRDLGEDYTYCAILRPTSPFRCAATIRRAFSLFLDNDQAHSLRAVEPCSQHPGKMWTVVNDFLAPLLLQDPSCPWHSRQYQDLPTVYVQNASLEIARTDIVINTKTIAGSSIVPFVTEGYEGLDVNTEKDFVYAEHLVNTGKAKLP